MVQRCVTMFSALKYCTVPGHIFRCPFFEDLVMLITYMSGSYGKLGQGQHHGYRVAQLHMATARNVHRTLDGVNCVGGSPRSLKNFARLGGRRCVYRCAIRAHLSH